MPTQLSRGRQPATHDRVKFRFSQPDMERLIEIFKGRSRHERLSQHCWFAAFGHVRSVIGRWRDDYKGRRSHRALVYG